MIAAVTRRSRSGVPGAERTDSGYRDVILERHVRQALAGLNLELRAKAREDAYLKLTRADVPSLIERNRIAGAQARVLDVDLPASNNLLARTSNARRAHSSTKAAGEAAALCLHARG